MRDSRTNNPQYQQRDDYGSRRSRYDYEDDRLDRQQYQQGQQQGQFGPQGGSWRSDDYDREGTRGQRFGNEDRYGNQTRRGGAYTEGYQGQGNQDRGYSGGFEGQSDDWQRQSRSYEQQPWSGRQNRGYTDGIQQNPYQGGGRFDFNQGQDTWNRGSGQSEWNRGIDGQAGRGQSSDTPYFQNAMQGRYGGGSGSSTMQGPNTGRGPKNYRRGDDKIIEDVCQQLERDGDIDASEIEVTCREGVITLKGKVSDRQAKRQAEECAEHAYGVKDVMNELKVDGGAFASQSESNDESNQSTKSGRKAN